MKKYPPDVMAKFCIEPPHPVGIFILILSLYFQSPAYADIPIISVLHYFRGEFPYSDGFVPV